MVVYYLSGIFTIIVQRTYNLADQNGDDAQLSLHSNESVTSSKLQTRK